MNGKKMMVYIVSFMLGISIVLTGCKAKQDVSVEPKKLVKMSISLQQGSAYEGVQTDPVALEIERRFGIQLDFKQLNEDQFMLQAASGELPDIVLAQRSWLKILINGNNIIPLDELIKQAPHVNSQSARIEFAKKHLSEGKGKLFALSTLGGPVTHQYMYDVGPTIRWDYYRELGYPEMKDADEFLQVLKRMQQIHPKVENGKQVYGFSLWNDWGIWPYKIYHTYGNGLEQLGTMEYDSDFNAKNFLLDETSAWWEGVKFYYKANQMGLLDPESFVQKFDNMQAKAANGQILATYASWTTQLNTELAKKGLKTSGFMPVPGIFPYVFHGGYSNNGSQDQLLVITNNNQHPERAMELIDFVFSEEGSRILWSGLEGTHWTRESGKAQFRDELIAQYDIVNTDFANTTGITKYHKLAGFNDATVHADGQMMNLAMSPELFIKYSNKLDRDYSDHYQVQYPGQLYDQLAEANKIKFLAINTDFQVATGSVPDEIKRIDGQLLEYIGKNVPKIIMANSNDEFNALRKGAIDEMLRMGLDQSNRYWQGIFSKTKGLFTK
ncbi:extracellular solute-binding protein [Paenibacillus cymbidii]|uniref:extracellular solute-binding protein n=1 Tax=Paenibacillus cymbidii TaxID=1639034 RepID=UPI0010815D1B|nr:extracellular solute-binding protein [Paenibacillus cymbidii]